MPDYKEEDVAESYLALSRAGFASSETAHATDTLIVKDVGERAEDNNAQASDSLSVAVEGAACEEIDDDHVALVNGQPFIQLPKDLYIPPDAMEVVLETFEGPLDLLLYLIRKQNLDILSVSVARITQQYMDYIAFMKTLRLELAAEYLVMAALLGEIKSRSLLPRQKDDEGEEEDPRVELLRRLQEYERYKKVAEDIEQLPRMGRDTFSGSASPPDYSRPIVHPDVNMKDLLWAFRDILARADMFESHHVTKEALSTRERMSEVLSLVGSDGAFVPFISLFRIEEGKLGVVVTFLAVLELIKESLLEIVQNEPFAPIHVRSRGSSESERDEALEIEPLEDNTSAGI